MTDGTIRVTLRLWGPIRLAAGCDAAEIDLPAGATVRRALELFYAGRPALEPFRAAARAAVGNDYVGEDHPLRGGEEISLIPPVQGG